MLAGGAPFYRTYQCRDGREVAIGSLETKFYHELLEMIGPPVSLLQSQYDASPWAERGEILAAIFAQRDLAAWVALLEGTAPCFSTVLRLSEVVDHPPLQPRSASLSINVLSNFPPLTPFSPPPPPPQHPPT